MRQLTLVCLCLFAVPLWSADHVLQSKALDGTAITLPTADHKPVLLVFWASWCGSCNTEARLLTKLHGELNGRVHLIGVNVDDQADAARPFIAKHKLPYPNIHDAGLAISDQMQVDSTPTLILFDGEMRELQRSLHLNKDMVSALRTVLKKQKKPTVGRKPTKPLTQVLARSPEQVIEKHASIMGTDIHILIHSEQREQAARAIAAAFDEMRRIDDALTGWRPVGQVWQVNKNSGVAPVTVSDELLKLIREAGRIHKLTDGLFDITYRGVGGLWNFYQQPHVIPTEAAIKDGLSRVGFERIEVNEEQRTVYLPVKGMEIGLGGIAKGYAVDRAVELIAAQGFEDFVVNAGGDLYVKGSEQASLWRVGIRHPRIDGTLLAEIPAKNYAVVTSGDYERYFIKDGRRYCHILNPKTGYPADACQSVTVLAANSMQADALATGIFIMGPERGLAFAESLQSVEVLIVGADGGIHMSSGFKN